MIRMTQARYLNVIMTVVALLLSILVADRVIGSRSQLQLVRPAYAANQGSGEWVFFPVGNQQVRRLVIWDRSSNVVYDYDSGGSLKNTWILGAPGERIEKR
jgi:hypothetical protein